MTLFDAYLFLLIFNYNFIPKYTQTMTSARCVGSEKPASNAYTRAAHMAPAAASLMAGMLATGPGINNRNEPQAGNVSR